MKNKLYRSLFVILTFTMIVSLSVAFPVSAEESEDVNIWETLTPAYMSAGFQSIEARLAGSATLEPMECIIVKDGYALYSDKYTGEVVCLKLKEKVDGEYPLDVNGIHKFDGYWSTNPYDISTSQTSTALAVTEAVKKRLYSQVIIQYTEDGSDKEFISYTDAAANDQIAIKAIRGGVRVEYTLGRMETRYLAPRVIKAEKWQALFDKIKESAGNGSAMRFDSYYVKVDLNDEKLSQAVRDQYAKDFPIAKQFPIYICTPDIKPAELSRIEGWLKKFYSFEQLDEDHAETGYQASDKVPPLFKLAIEYTIDESGLLVRCNAGNIRFDSSSYGLSNVILLPYAGAGNVNNSGYIFTPDGSGTIIEFDDAFGKQFSLNNSVYGQDYAFSTISGANREITRLPVFGVVETETVPEPTLVDREPSDETTDDTTETQTPTTETTDPNQTETEVVVPTVTRSRGYLAIVEEGESLSSIIINSGGSSYTYVSAYTMFNPRQKDSYMLSGGISASTNAMWTVESKRKYTDDYKIRIIILSDAEASYAGMANAYREYLQDTGVLTPLSDTTEDIPLYIETLGAMDTTKRILGVPVDTKIALTTFTSTIEMLRKLKSEADISNVNIKLSGWANGGMEAVAPNGVEIEKVLGGELDGKDYSAKEAFKLLLEYAAENSVGIFPDFDFAYVSNEGLFDGFNAKDHLAKTIDNRGAYKKVYDSSLQAYEYTKEGVLSANVMASFYSNTYADYSKYNVGAISISTLGDSLSSDFNKDDPLTREDSKKLVTQLLEKVKADNGEVMISGGNAYALEYATHILDIPLESSMFKYSSASIPFMSMVLHGSIEYAGTPINLAGDARHMLLKCIESGANPYFIIAMPNTSELKNSEELSAYYSIKYSIWLNDIVDTYNELNIALGDVQQSYIIDHTFLDEDNNVAKVTYDNGTVFYINYLLTDFTFTDNGVTYTIGDEDFIKLDASGNIVEH